jgi:3-deoxy-D-manno-octulosonic-acid transferase
MIYNIAIALYAFAVRLVSPFNKKAKKMLAGQKQTFSLLKKAIDPEAKYIWFHSASLGEFEQGRPLIEKIRKEKPDYRILLTFFSPSGYEMRKNYAGADIVCYLPFDHFKNARKFLDLTQPTMAIFIKYEFWMNYLNQLKSRNIPTYIISAVFRKSQLFFRWYGRKYRNVLNDFDWFFVQDNNSLELLKRFNHHNVTVSGDTRFDRVKEIFESRKTVPEIEKFLNYSETNQDFALIAGSSWEKDEDILIPWFNRHPDIKLIIAPHEIEESRIESIKNRMTRPVARLSKPEEIEKADCLIIDCIGLLSSAYRYGSIAYIGGGFGVGIHNILEAAVYGTPVVFGPNYHKFREAKELIACGGGSSVAGSDEFTACMGNYSAYSDLRLQNGKSAKEYVVNNLGATNKIYEKIFITCTTANT